MWHQEGKEEAVLVNILSMQCKFKKVREFNYLVIVFYIFEKACYFFLIFWVLI